jgi:succinoglycan biosynthesis protein ExoM
MRERLVVCVLTCLRPQLLRSCLASLEGQQFRKSPEPEITVLVVDNDAGGSGHAFCKEARTSYRWNLVSCIERTRGISFARNTAIRQARALGNLVAFVDDDETVDEAWADELLDSRARHGADVVTGPVLSLFPGGAPPAWAEGCEVFFRRRYPTGTIIKEAITGNVLLGPAVLDRYPEPFDARFALSGGEDSHFFRTIALAGYKIVYCNDAIARETVPRERMSLKYVLGRTFRTTVGFNRSVWLLRPTLGFVCERVAKSLFRLSLGLGQLLATGAFSASGRVRGLVNITKAAGTWAAFLNVRPKAYGKPAATNALDQHEGLSGTRS